MAAGTPQASSEAQQQPSQAPTPVQARTQAPPSNATGQPLMAGAQPSDFGEVDAPAFGDVAAAADLQAEIAMLRAKSGELADQYLRAKADAENARRRADDEVSKARKFAVEAFAESMLPVLDSLEAGLAIKNATVQQIQDGTNGTLQQLKAALERNKVLPVDPKPGEKFDPN
ncbi:MAG: nucleotide exchange factor GrpE, partial [Lysobacteraceae bacterium]